MKRKDKKRLKEKRRNHGKDQDRCIYFRMNEKFWMNFRIWNIPSLGIGGREVLRYNEEA